MAKRKGHRGGKPPIRSKAQWRYLFASHKPFARRWAHMTPGGPKVRYRRLPARKHPRKRI
jgi:hypothetical protein